MARQGQLGLHALVARGQKKCPFVM